MVEHRPWNDIIAYAILTLGVFIVAFPVYLALIASTHDAATVVGGQMPLSPGSHILENYYRAIFVGGSRTSREPVGHLLFNSLVSATGTLLFRQFFMTVPDELLEASKIDGAGPFRFFKDTLLPLSVTTIAALFVIQFIYGWNQYLWPLLITTQDSMQTIVTGIKKMLTTTDELAEWQLAMATAIPVAEMKEFISMWPTGSRLVREPPTNTAR